MVEDDEHATRAEADGHCLRDAIVHDVVVRSPQFLGRATPPRPGWNWIGSSYTSYWWTCSVIPWLAPAELTPVSTAGVKHRSLRLAVLSRDRLASRAYTVSLAALTSRNAAGWDRWSCRAATVGPKSVLSGNGRPLIAPRSLLLVLVSTPLRIVSRSNRCCSDSLQ